VGVNPTGLLGLLRRPDVGHAHPTPFHRPGRLLAHLVGTSGGAAPGLETARMGKPKIVLLTTTPNTMMEYETGAALPAALVAAT
jgi:hypothetical protein